MCVCSVFSAFYVFPWNERIFERFMIVNVDKKQIYVNAQKDLSEIEVFLIRYHSLYRLMEQIFAENLPYSQHVEKGDFYQDMSIKYVKIVVIVVWRDKFLRLFLCAGNLANIMQWWTENLYLSVLTSIIASTETFRGMFKYFFEK